MALLKIVHFPDPRLRVQTKPVTDFGDELQQLIDDMFETMYENNGAGLASTQVGLDIQLSVIDISYKVGNKPFVIINPEIIEATELTRFEEGCLSVPHHYDALTRANKVKVKALDRFGKPFEMEGEGLLAEVLQHEIDHLNGKLYIDYLSTFKQKRIRVKIEKIKKLQQKANKQ